MCKLAPLANPGDCRMPSNLRIDPQRLWSTLVAAGYETNAPFVVVNWTNEEGARFAPAMLGSGVFAGVYSRAQADAIADIEGVRFGEALDGIGWRGETKIGMPLSAYLELHI